LIYSGTVSDIRVKLYCHLNFLRSSVFYLERLDKLLDSIGHPCIKLLSFEFPTSFHFQFGVARYITGLNRTSENKFIVVQNCSELVSSISSISIYYGTQSDIRAKSYCRLNLIGASIFNLEVPLYYETLSDIRVKSYCPLNCLRAYVFNLERIDILRDSFGHPCIKLFSFDIATSFCFQYGASRYIMGLNRTFEKKVIVV